MVALPPQLTPRERIIVLALVRHGTYQRTADALGISQSTVKIHVQNVLSKFGADSFTILVVKLWPILGAQYRLPGDKE